MRRALTLAAFAALGCSSAHILPPEDAAPDAGARDAASTDGGARDAGGRDAEAPRILAPDLPIGPLADPEVVGRWLPDAEVDTLASADPRVARPRPPAFGDCGSWGGGDAIPCEPWPGGPRTCAAGTERFPGDAACARLGPACPLAGEWAAELPVAATTLYVRPGAASGTGTAAAPFGTLAEALSEATSRAVPVVIALSGASYPGPFVLPEGITLAGACTQETIVTASATEVAITAGTMTGLLNLSVRGGARGVEVPSGATLAIEAVRVEDGGLWVQGALEATELVVEGAGVQVEGTLVLRRGVIREVTAEGILGADGSSVTLTDTAISDVGGAGVDSVSGSVDADGLVVERSGGGVGARFGVAITLRRSALRDLSGIGIAVLDGVVTVETTRLERVAGHALWFRGPTATVRDVLIRDVAPLPPYYDGDAIATWATPVMLQRVSIERADGEGLSIWEGGSVTAIDLVILDTGLDPAASLVGAGILVTDGADLTLSASRIARTRVAGIMAGGCISGHCYGDTERAGLGTVATLVDVEIADTAPSFDRSVAGHGLLVTGGAALDATRVMVSGSDGALLALGHQSLALPDSLVYPGTANLNDVMLRDGGGVIAADGSTIEGVRVVVSDVSGTAIEARGAGSIMTLEDVVIADVGAVAGGAPGLALVANDEGVAVLERVWMRRVADLAAHALGEGSLTLTDAAIASVGRVASVEGAAQLVLERVTATDVRAGAIEARGPGTTMNLTDVAVTGSPAAVGFGLLARQSAQVTSHAIELELSRTALVAIADRDTRLVASHTTLRCASGSTASCSLLSARTGASAMLDAARLVGARGAGAVAFEGASIALSEVRVEETALGCGEGCAIALGAYDTAELTATRFVIDGSAGVGAQLADAGATLTLIEGMIARAAVCVELPALVDVSAVLGGVLLEECERDVSRTPGPRAIPSL